MLWLGDVEPPVFSDATDRRPCTPPLLPAFKESKDEWRFYAFKNWLFFLAGRWAIVVGKEKIAGLKTHH